MTFYPPLLHLRYIALTVRIAMVVILAVTPFCIQAESSDGGNSEVQHQSAPLTPDDVNRVLRLECHRQGTSWIGCSRMAGTAYLFLAAFGIAAWDQGSSEAISNQGDFAVNAASGDSTAGQQAAFAAKEAADFYWAAFAVDPAVTDKVRGPSADLATVAKEEAGALATRLKALGVDSTWADLVKETITADLVKETLVEKTITYHQPVSSPTATSGGGGTTGSLEIVIGLDKLQETQVAPVLDKIQKARVAKWPDPEFFEIRRGYSPTTPELAKSYGKF